MGKFLKNSLVILFTGIIFLSHTVTYVAAEDFIRPSTPANTLYLEWVSLSGGVYNNGNGRTNTSLSIRLPDGRVLSCADEHYGSLTDSHMSWYWNSNCFQLPGTITVGGVTYTLHRDGSPYGIGTSLYHGYEGVADPHTVGTCYFVVTDKRGHYALTWDVTYSLGTGIVALHSSENRLNYDYRTLADAGGTTHYSPIVDGNTPNPSYSTTGDNIGTITGYINTKSVNLGSSVDTSPQYPVTGGYHGRSLTYVSGGSTTATDTYTSTRDVSGASSITNGTTYTGIGTGEIAWSVKDYEADITNFKEKIIVKTDSNGGLGVQVWTTADNQIYANQWMSSHATADAFRRAGLSMQGNTTIPGSYDLLTQLNGTRVSNSGETKAATAATPFTNGMRTGIQNANTTAAGLPVTSQAVVTGEHGTTLSPKSNVINVRYDNTPPTLSTATPNADWTAITTNAADALSGLETGTGGVFYKIVAKNVTAGTTLPTDTSNEWASLTTYSKPSAAGDYDVYVYAKDNATNRSPVVKVGTFNVPPKTASIKLSKRVVGNRGNANDVFLISMKEGSTLVSSLALKRGETSGALAIGMEGVTSRVITISEIIPMDYATGFTISIANQSGSKATFSGRTVTIYPGDDVTITVENTFAPTEYFKGKDFVKNIFK